MHPILPFLPLTLTFLLLVIPCVGFTANYLGNHCLDPENYTKNSTFEANLKQLFLSLPTQTAINAGFSKNITGSPPNQVSGLFLCTGDIITALCDDCVQDASQLVTQKCPYKKDTLIWLDGCLLHYSNKNLLSSYDNSELYLLWNTQDVSSDKPIGATRPYFINLLSSLLTNVSYLTAYNSSKRFYTGELNITNSSSIYGLTQGTPDMPSNTCKGCLDQLTNFLLDEFNGSEGARLLGGRCLLRYEIYPFFHGSPLWTNQFNEGTTPIRATKGHKRKIIIIVSSIAAALFLVGCSVMCIRKIRHKGTILDSKSSEVAPTLNQVRIEARMLEYDDEIRDIWRNDESNSEVSLFSFSQVENATNYFSLENRIGQGGFGPVYKGVLPNGLEIAVKRLSSSSAQGLSEFRTEIQLIAKLQHKNLVRLVGWSIHEEEKLLVYEFMPNKSLDFFIFDEARGASLNWQKRFQIIEGIAQGLLYLHKHSRLKIIHRDLKLSNILLDADMTPKISDFGLARIFGANELQANTARIVGSYGYMAPEYASQGLFSEKSDVFSFGVMLLEIVSGKRNLSFHQNDFLNLLGYAWDQWRGGKWLELIEPSLTDISNKEIERCICIALLCAQENPIDRPTISNVLAFLSSENIILPEPKQPAYFNLRTRDKATSSSDFCGSTSSINDMSITKQEGR